MPLPAYRPQLATLVKEPPRGAGWIHEVKYDGYRIGCAIERGRVRLVSRQGNDWTDRFPEIVSAAGSLAVREALLDGEAAVVAAGGRTSFQALQNVFGGGARRGLTYFAFDLLWLDGDDVSRRPLVERRAALRRLLDGAPAPLRLSDAFEGDGPAVFREACRLGLEGIVSKRAADPWRPGRTGWTKAKCLLRASVVVGGYTDMEGHRGMLGALLAGVHEHGTLRYAGKVGTGWTNEAGAALLRRLRALASAECPFSPRPAGWLGKHGHWVRPEVVAEVAFTEWTGDGMLRHPRLVALREDEAAADVRREWAAPVPTPAVGSPTTRPRARQAAGSGRAPFAARTDASAGRSETPPATPARGARPSVRGVALSHPERVVDPSTGATKLDLARYHDAVADAMLPHLRGRPLTLVHCPAGLEAGCRYMKHSKLWAPAAIRRVRIREKTKLGEYLVADDAPALLSLVQMDVVEIHTWNSTVAALERPDRIVIDLDPGPDVPFGEVVAAALLARDALRALGLASFAKTTGGVGLHVVAPLAPARDWTECLAFARGLAAAIAAHDPARFTTRYALAGRERKILVDYLRNNRTNTSVAAFSARARAGLPVSVPVAWDELDRRLRPERFTIRTVPRRLRALGADPWAAYAAVDQRISPAALRAVAPPAHAPARRR